MTRWATFACYGTLIDANAGIGDELARLWGEERRGGLLTRYHEIEPRLQAGADGRLPYRTVLTEALVALAAEEGLVLPDGEREALGRSLPRWRAFPEVPVSLSAVRERGWRIALLANTDRDSVEAALETIGVPFDEVVVASEIGSYKPALGHWRTFSERTGADPARHVHVGASLVRDAHPAAELGLPLVWINREAERATVPVARQLASLAGLATALDALVS